jgi:hypothetical protein
MVMESIKLGLGNEKSYTEAERVSMRLTRNIAERTRIWIGALTEPHLGSFGTDLAIFGNNDKTRIGTGIASTIIVGHFVIQIVTQRTFPEFASQNISDIQPRTGNWEEMVMELYPERQKKHNWPPKISFANGGPKGIAYLMHRWRIGQKVNQVKPSR